MHVRKLSIVNLGQIFITFQRPKVSLNEEFNDSSALEITNINNFDKNSNQNFDIVLKKASIAEKYKMKSEPKMV